MVDPSGDEYKDQSANDVIWLHGAGLSGDTWRSDVGGIKPDLPGHKTADCIANPSVERYADCIEPLLPDRFALVGHSLGGMVALELAARHPRRVRGLVLAEAVPTVLQSPTSIFLARIHEPYQPEAIGLAFRPVRTGTSQTSSASANRINDITRDTGRAASRDAL